MSDKPKCCADCADHSGRSTLFYGCGRPGKVKVDGKWYCGIHDPLKAQAKRAAREAKWASEREWNARVFRANKDMLSARDDLLVCAVEALPDFPEVIAYVNAEAAYRQVMKDRPND